MFTGVRVDHAALDRASDDLLTAATRVGTRLDQLESELTPLQSGWDGAARASYAVAQKQWDTAMAEMVALLKEFSVTVQEANDAYRAADRRGAQRFG